MQRVCIGFKGKVVKKGHERYRTLRFQTDKGNVKLPLPSFPLWENIEIWDSIYKASGSNRCLIIKRNGRRLELPYDEDDHYRFLIESCGDCDSDPVYKTDNPNPYNTR